MLKRSLLIKKKRQRLPQSTNRGTFELKPEYKYTNGVLKVGHWAQLTKQWTEADVREFSRLTGDANPLHIDEQYAMTTPFKRRIVHGMLSGSLIGTVAACTLPGPGSIYLSQTFKFRCPVFIDDTVTATIQIKDINPKKKFVNFYTKVENQHGVVVIDGEALTLAPENKITGY